MNRTEIFHRHGILAILALAGCAPLAVPPAPTLHYRCDSGSEFKLTIAASGDAAILEFSGMQFGLRAETSTAAGQRFGCDVLTVWREGERARIEMDGAQEFSSCRLKP